MVVDSRKILRGIIEEERRRNLKDAIRHAVWNAEMVRRLGEKWFEIRDRWLNEAFEADRRLWESCPEILEALKEAILTKDRLKRRRRTL